MLKTSVCYPGAQHNDGDRVAPHSMKERKEGRKEGRKEKEEERRKGRREEGKKEGRKVGQRRRKGGREGSEMKNNSRAMIKSGEVFWMVGRQECSQCV